MSIADQQIPNPIKKIRTELHMTQREAADVCEVTEQVVLKTEQGLYPTVPPSVLFAFASLSNLSVGLIEASYEDWINQELRKVKVPTNTFMTDFWNSATTFPEWRGLVCALNDVPNSVNAFCKLFKMNPYVIQKYEGGKLKATPVQLVERVAYIKGEM